MQTLRVSNSRIFNTKNAKFSEGSKITAPRKIDPNPNFNANPKPNPNPNQEAFFLAGNCPQTFSECYFYMN